MFGTRLNATASIETTAHEALIQSSANRDKIDALAALLDARFAANEKAVEHALKANDKRLESMNEFRGALTDQTNRMITRVEALSVLENATKKTDADVNVLRDRMEQSSRPNYPVLIGALSMSATVLAAVWMIVGLKIEATITPTGMAVVAIQEHEKQQDMVLSTVSRQANDSMQADLVSRSDRMQIASRLGTLENSVSSGQADRRAKEESVRQKLVEVETQFCASDIIRNLMHAQDMRIESIMWSRVLPDTKMPTDNAYYPQICNRSIDLTAGAK